MQQFSLVVPQKLVVSSNRQAQVWQRKKLKDYCAETMPYLVRDLHPMGRATVYVGVTKRTNGRYDPVNLTDTAKPLVDQLVKAGVLDEDDHRHVMGPWLYHKGTNKRLVDGPRFTVTLTDYSEITF